MELKISPRSVQQEAVRMIRDAITRGHFPPGMRLVEAKLCSQLGVSRSSVREALRVLAAEKLITIVPNKGPSVAELSWDEAEDIYHMRVLLEGEAAAIAARHATPADVAALDRAFDAFRRAVADDDWERRLSATGDFYDILIARCGNRVLGETLHGLLARINFLRAKTMAREGRALKSIQELERIRDAIAAGDARAARAAAVAHVREAELQAREVYRAVAAA